MPTQWPIEEMEDACFFFSSLFSFFIYRAVFMCLAVVLCFAFNISEFKDPGEKSGKCWGTFF